RPDPRFLQVRRLTEVSRALTYAASQNEVLDLTVRETAGLLRTERVALLATEPAGTLAIRASPTVRREVQRSLRQTGGIEEEAVARLKTILEHGGGVRFLAVPLVIAGEVAGVLAAAPAAASEALEDDEWLLSAIADQAAVTLEKLRLQT